VSEQPRDLQEQVRDFAAEMSELLARTLYGLSGQLTEILAREDRFVIHPPGGRPLPLYVGTEHLANMKLSVSCQMDSPGRYLAVEESNFNLLAALDRTPVLRFHYYRKPRGKPAAHLHFHGHRGALTHLLSKSGHEKPHDISSLHVPVGGARFRPCLEDFIQFLIYECGFKPQPDWQTHIVAGRERWRRRQAAAVVRDVPEEAARVLRELGYKVESPEPVPADQPKALRDW
jgi:hypothetical protein